MVIDYYNGFQGYADLCRRPTTPLAFDEQLIEVTEETFQERDSDLLEKVVYRDKVEQNVCTVPTRF